MNIQRVIAKNFSITCIFNQCNLFNNLIHSSLSSNVHRKTGIQMFA